MGRRPAEHQEILVGQEVLFAIQLVAGLMEIGKLGVWFFLDGMTAPQTVAYAQKVERLGYSALWIPEAVGREPFPHGRVC